MSAAVAEQRVVARLRVSARTRDGMAWKTWPATLTRPGFEPIEILVGEIDCTPALAMISDGT